MRDVGFDAWVRRARAVPIEREIERRGITLNGGKIARCGPCPRCGGDDRFSINSKKGIFNCRVCGAKGDVIDLVRFLDDCDFITAGTTLAGEPPPKANDKASANGKDSSSAAARKIVAEEYAYLNPDGSVAFVVERIEYQNLDRSYILTKEGKRKKTFRQKRPDPDQPGRWIYNVNGAPIIPYRLPESLEAAGKDQTILIVEGERKVDLLWSWNVPATCCAGGAEKWRPEHSAFLAGADVVILLDNDAAGRKHANVVAASLRNIAASVRVLDLPDLPPKGDIVDWAKAGGTVEQLHDLIHREAKPWTVSEPASEPGVSLDDFFAYMPMHSYIFTPSRDLWPPASVNARLPPVIAPDGKPIRPSAWLDANAAVEQMTWAPGKATLIEDKLIGDGSWIERPGCKVFNLYRPPTIAPRTGDVAPWLDLVRRVFPSEADHIVSWLAHRVQRPHEKINHALVLGGKSGIGKDTILEPVKQAVGPWNFADVSPKQVLGRFNSFLRSVILRVNEARDLGEFDRYAFHDHMKSYIAAPPDVLRIDEKNLREYYVFNICGVVITSNHKTDGIFLPADDRRHMVAWSNLTKDNFADDYWRKLYGWYANGGNEHVAAYLAKLDITSFDPKAPPPKTQAFWEIANANRAPEDAELADVLDDLGRPDVLTLSQVANRAAILQPALAEWLRDRKNRRNIPHRFEDCEYVAVANPNDTEGRWKIGGARHTIYGKARLTVHDRLAAAYKFAGAR